MNLSSSRRGWIARVLTVTAGLWLAGAAVAPAFAQSSGQPGVLRIGFQKSASLLVLLKSQQTLEKRLEKQGVQIKWVEFPAGPQLLEGLNVGSVDLGFVGEAPPIVAQAAGADFVYVGADPAAPEAEAVVVPKDSPIKTVAELKGKKIALNKGSNVHYLLAKLLEKHGLKYTDVQVAFLTPADARAAFERGAVDAWAIWDPFLSAAEKQVGARVLASGKGVVPNYQFYLAARPYVEKNGEVLAAVFDELRTHGRWLKANLKEGASRIAPLQGLDVAVVESSLARYSFEARPVTPEEVQSQQRIADTFLELKIIPRKINVADALPNAATRVARQP